MKERVFALIIPIVIIANVLSYRIKFILRKNGYKVNYFYGHFRDLPNFWDLIRKEEDQKLKRNYILLFSATIFAFVLFIIAVGVMISN